MKKLKYLIPAIVLVFLAYRYLCPEKLDVAYVTRGPAVKAIYATGSVEATEMLPLAPRVAGRIEKILADEGDTVSEGQEILRLEAEESDALLAQLRSRVDILTKEFSRVESLLEKNATTRELFDRAKSELEISEAALSAELARTEYLTLRAPKDGVIIQRDGELGQYIPSNQAVFWFSSNAPKRISAEVDEEDISQIALGQKVLIRSDAFKDQVFEGEVSGITPKGDPVARSYRVRIGLKEDYPLLIGMTVENNIIQREESNALLVPTTSILKKAVWIVSDSVLEERDVEVGAKGGDLSEIVSGVSEGEIVVLRPSDNLKSKTKIRLRFSEAKDK